MMVETKPGVFMVRKVEFGPLPPCGGVACDCGPQCDCWRESEPTSWTIQIGDHVGVCILDCEDGGTIHVEACE